MRPHSQLTTALLITVAFIAITSPSCSCPQAQQTSKAPEAPLDQQQLQPTESPKQVAKEQDPKKADNSTENAPAAPKSTEQVGEKRAESSPNNSPQGSVTGKSADGVKGAKTPTTAGAGSASGNSAAARKKADQLAQGAKSAAVAGNYAKAFRDARAAWEQVAPYTDDAQSQEAAKSLLKDIGEYAAKANEAAGGKVTGKTLVVE